MAVLTVTLADQKRAGIGAPVANPVPPSRPVAVKPVKGEPKPARDAWKVKLVAGVIGERQRRADDAPETYTKTYGNAATGVVYGFAKDTIFDNAPCVRVMHKGQCYAIHKTMDDAIAYANARGWKILEDREIPWERAFELEGKTLAGPISGHVNTRDDGTRFAPVCYVTDLDPILNDAMAGAVPLADWK